MDQDFITTVTATLETGGADLDASLPMVRAALARDAAARADLLQWQVPPKPNRFERFAQSVFCEGKRKGRRR